MLTTVEEVASLTNYDVTLEHIRIAQGIIETVIGKSEAEVTNPNDLVFVGRAVAYQAAYVSKNFETIFEQMAVRAITQSDGNIILDVELLAPYVAPLAMYALRNVSIRHSKSVKTGAMFGAGPFPTPWELD